MDLSHNIRLMHAPFKERDVIFVFYVARRDIQSEKLVMVNLTDRPPDQHLYAVLMAQPCDVALACCETLF